MIRKIVSIILSAAIHVLLLCALLFHAAKGSGGNGGSGGTHIRAALVSASGSDASEGPDAGLETGAANGQAGAEASKAEETPNADPERAIETAESEAAAETAELLQIPEPGPEIIEPPK
ncbi:MAG: hypothetical protein LBS35_05110, partial [Synergistaceae bacterium]|nr:hypothetical protein [Synergistaceae bacterium]